eukprot:SAG11_NODE_855_length_6868_cov_3.086128_4_plen_282_part_00
MLYQHVGLLSSDSGESDEEYSGPLSHDPTKVIRDTGPRTKAAADTGPVMYRTQVDEIAARLLWQSEVDALIDETSADPANKRVAAGALPLLPVRKVAMRYSPVSSPHISTTVLNLSADSSYAWLGLNCAVHDILTHSRSTALNVLVQSYPHSKPWVGLRHTPFNLHMPPIRQAQPPPLEVAQVAHKSQDRNWNEEPLLQPPHDSSFVHTSTSYSGLSRFGSGGGESSERPTLQRSEELRRWSSHLQTESSRLSLPTSQPSLMELLPQSSGDSAAGEISVPI